MSSNGRAQFNANMLEFLRTELETGITFASVAIESESEDKRHRNTKNARKAYDTAQHFLEEHAPDEMLARPDLHEALTKLRALLVQLGEKVEG